MASRRRLAPSVLLGALLLGCDTAPIPTPVPPTATTATAACAVTIPNGSLPPPAANADPLKAPCPDCLGNGSLWTTYPADGQIRITPNSSGLLEAKFPWWRAPDISDNALTVQGHRLDAPAPPLQPRIPAGYEGQVFQAGAVVFPTAGCWEITGQAGSASLTFVVQVIAESNGNAP